MKLKTFVNKGARHMVIRVLRNMLKDFSYVRIISVVPPQ